MKSIILFFTLLLHFLTVYIYKLPRIGSGHRSPIINSTLTDLHIIYSAQYTMSYFTTISEDDNLKNALFVNVLRSEWKKVIEIYKDDPRAHRVTITSQGQTALHIAVSDDKDDVVERLVEAIKASSPSALKIADKRGQTALHIAAATGNTTMCECMAKADLSLLTQRNKEGETPLFTAVLYGRREAFRCLAKLSNWDITLCRRSDDGKTILHVAILGQELGILFKSFLCQLC